MDLVEKYSGYLSLLDKGKTFSLDWITQSGRNIGINVWIDSRNNKVVFTNMADAINEEVFELEEKDLIASTIENYVNQGYGEDAVDIARREKEKHLFEERLRIGDRIRAIREERGFTQAHLADLTGLKVPNISRIESGKYSTGQDILSAIAKALDKQLDFI